MASTSGGVAKVFEDEDPGWYGSYLLQSASLVPMVAPGGYDIFTCDRMGVCADHWMRKEMLNRLLKHPNVSIIVKNLTGVYVLIGRLVEQNFLRKGEEKWSDILTPEAYLQLQHDRFVIFGWILVTKCPGENKVYGIDLLESYVRGRRVGELLQYKVRRYLDATAVLPIELSGEGYGYWKKMLPRRFPTRHDFISYCQERGIEDPEPLFHGYDDIWDEDDDNKEEEEEEEEGNKKKKHKLNE